MRLLLLVLLILSGCATQSPRIWAVESQSQVNLAEINLYDKHGKIVRAVPTSDVRMYINTCRRVAAVPNQNITFVVAEGDSPNAFAWYQNGKGMIAFNFGIIKLLEDSNDESMVAALCGHEISHLVLRHGEKTAKRNAGITALETVAGLALSVAGVPMGGTIADVSGSMVSTAYSRAQESEADEYGVKYMASAGYDPKGAIRLFKKLDKASHTLSIPFLSTHPSPPERIANIRKEIEEMN